MTKEWGGAGSSLPMGTLQIWGDRGLQGAESVDQSPGLLMPSHQLEDQQENTDIGIAVSQK